MTARHEYGAAPLMPPGAFELVLRKVKGSGSHTLYVSPAEADLELAQIRSDLLDGRLTRALLTDECLDLACVLALREMHVRGPRLGLREKSSVALSLSAARSKKQGGLRAASTASPSPLPAPEAHAEAAQISPSFNSLATTHPALATTHPPPHPYTRVTRLAANPTLDLDLKANELHTVLPPALLDPAADADEADDEPLSSQDAAPLWERSSDFAEPSEKASPGVTVGAGSAVTFGAVTVSEAGVLDRPSRRVLDRLKERYRTLLKKPLDKWAPHLAARSATAQIIQNVRQEALGVAFDSKGMVVVDRKGAERILRDRLADEPLCLGCTYTCAVWAGPGRPCQAVLVALNHSGLHLHTIEPRPRRLGSLVFEWQVTFSSLLSLLPPSPTFSRGPL